MTSNPLLQEEDTDDNFFDKLVNDRDELDFNFTARSSSLNSVGPIFGDGNQFDEVKAFANLSIDDAKSSSQTGDNKFVVDHSNELEIHSNGELHDVVGVVKDGLVVNGVMEEEGKSVLESPKSSEFVVFSDLNTLNVGSEGISDRNLSNGNGVGVASVREVQWTAFNADSPLNDSNDFGSYSDFFSELGQKADKSSEVVAGNFLIDKTTAPSTGDTRELVNLENPDIGKYQDSCNYGAGVQQNSGGQGDSIEDWEKRFPVWKINPNTGLWYQVKGYETGSNSQGNAETVSSYNGASSCGKAEVSYFQQSFQTVGGTMAESTTTQNGTNWSCGNISLPNQVSQGTAKSGALDWNHSVNQGYPSHMIFDPQYPGWYFDTIAQDWKSLEAYNLSSDFTVLPQDQSKQNEYAATSPVSMNDYQKVVHANVQADNNGNQRFSNQGQLYNLSGSVANYNHQDSNAWQQTTALSNVRQHETVTKSEPTLNYRENQEEYHIGLDFSRHDQINQQVSYVHGRVIPSYEENNNNEHSFSAISTPQSSFPVGNFGQQYTQPRMDLTERVPFSNDYYSNQNPSSFSQQQFHGAQQFSPVLATGRSSSGRPAHALVAFGFGGKLIIAKNNNSISFGSQNPAGSSIDVLSLKEIVLGTTESNAALGASDYFRALCLQSFPGPLIGGSGGLKELNKWFDERIQNSGIHHHKGEVLRLLLSLLKLSCQYYGKLRSPIGFDTGLKESDVPEVAVARLFASAKNSSTQFNESGAISHCLQALPSEGQMRATAAEVQNLLVSGRKIEAFHYAQEGQLWGPAITLAAQLGDQCYMETIKQMALRQLVPGSPLRTLCLLIAGQPGDVFSSETSVNSSMLGAINMNKQPAEFGSPRMLGSWEENLAVITANRTKDDELVLLHLGDCLLKERNDVIAAHICYLVAEADFEPYSDTARLCLLGADHWKSPRTYASPEAIQRTEIFEYSKVIGNSQFTFLPFQPYKFIYAHMLAEVGRISDALKYCQAVSKSLKTGRAPEVENFRQSVAALEERIKNHQQGGFTNLVPAKFVGKLFGLLDSAAHRVVGGLPPPVPTTSGGSPPVSEQNQLAGSRVSTMAISSPMNSAFVEPITERAADGSTMTTHNWSVSEPDFSTSPRQGQTDSSKEVSSAVSKGETSGGRGKSRLGRFGFGSQLLKKTIGLVYRPLQGRQQAKLGEKNKFYYNEKLKSWVEEGAEPPNEETILPPPPINPYFQNGLTDDYNLKAVIKSEGTLNNGSPAFKSPLAEQGSGTPPPPPTSTQYSARGKMGVRSRYVDTFNNGGANQTNLYQPPSLPSSKSATVANPKFFVPTPINTYQETLENATDSKQGTSDNENVMNTVPNGLPQSPAPPPPPPPSMTMHRFGSMGSISSKVTAANSSVSAPSRRTASCGSFGEILSPPSRNVKPLGKVLGMPPSNFLPSNTAVMSSAANGVTLSDGLHEVVF